MAILRTYDDNEDILRDLKRCLENLRGWGIPIVPTSRFVRYAERMEQLMARPLGIASPAEIQQLQFDIREIDELIAIVDSFPKGPGEVARERLELVVTGSEDPDSETTSVGRDAQWELYLRALLRRADIPAALGNPDVLARVLKTEVPIEAKRPKTEKRLDDRLRKGVSQLEANGVPGVVALSLDRAIREGRGVLHGPTVPAVEEGVASLLHELVIRQLRNIVARVQGRPILGLIFHARLPTWIDGAEQMRLVTVTHIEVVSLRENTKLILDRLITGLNKA